MKKTALLLSIAFIALVVTGLILYYKFFQRNTLSVWQIIPEHAIVVYESGECKSCLAKIHENPLWMSFKEILFKRGSDATLQGKILQDITGSYNWFTSLHLTQRNDFDLVFYLPDAIGFKDKTEQWTASSDFNVETHEYSGFPIYELRVSNQIFSWTFVENIWIGSFTSFLIEDVIRTFKSDGALSFDKRLEAARKLPVVRNDLGNIYIRYEGLNALMASFLQDGSGVHAIVGNSGLLDIKPGTALNLNGFSLTDNSNSTSLLGYFIAQNPVPFSHKRFVSNRALVVANYGVDQGEAFLRSLPLSKESKVQDSLISLVPIQIQELFSALGKEISVCLFERRKSELAKIVLFDAAETGVWAKAFDLLSRATESGDSLYVETYASYEFRKIDIKDLPGKLFRPLVSGFDQTYYTLLGNTFILAEYPADLKRFLDDIEQEEVWSKSVSTNQFLESTLLESNIGLYFNIPLLKNALVQRLAPTWKTYFSEHPEILSRPSAGAIQFSNLNGMFYTHAILLPGNGDLFSAPDKPVKQRVQSLMGSVIKSPLFTVRNHITKQYDVVFQDSLRNLCYFSADGKIQWTIPVEGIVTGSINQIDYFNNGKLQLFFVTPGRLHVIDRLGNYVSPFPVSIPVENPEFVNVIDYDNSKRYRYILSDQMGKVWMFDKQGKLLDGWRPRLVDGKPIGAPRHYRIQGKDFIVMVRQDGQVHIMNRKGEFVKGFPLALDVRPSGSYYFEPGKNLAGSVFTCISKDGIRIRFTAEGKILSREQLVKSTVSDQFSLIEEKVANGYVIARQSAKRLTLFDDDGREMVVNDYVGMNRLHIQYYDFGSGKLFCVVTDLDQGLSYLYDGNGNSITPAPVDASSVAISWEAGIKLYSADGKLVTMEVF
ncbi:MAG: hypothetical protein ACK4RF_12070 [Cyclobacteriaceae bacterium]